MRFLGIALLFSSTAALAASPRYQLTELFSVKFDAYDNYAYGIDSRGEIVGQTSLKRYDGAFSYFNGKFSEIGDLMGGRGSSIAYAINNSGQIVGESFSPAGGTHAFFFSPGTGITDLGAFYPAYSVSHAYGINNAGQVVGWSKTSTLDSTGNDYESHAFVVQASPSGPLGGMTDLGTLGGEDSTAYGINNAGHIVGSADIPGGTTHAFLYSGGAMADLGTLGGVSSTAYAINTGGQIAGEAQTGTLTNPSHAFLRTGGAMRDLGTLGGFNSSARALNSRGDVVGSSDIKHSTMPHAFLFTNGRMTDLNREIPAPSSKLVLVTATGINDYGQITGYGISPVNGYTAWILSPLTKLTITSRQNHVTSRRQVVVRGKTGIGARAVNYRIGRHRSRSAIGVSRWHFPATLHSGTNVITIRVTGAAGDRLSKIVTITRR